MPRVVRRERLVPNIHLLEVEAPEIARKCRPGQFVIVMPDARGERIPLTIADWDRERGTVTSVFMAVGTTTRKLALLAAGDTVPIFAGPLGRPSEIGPVGTVLCAGGCFGIAAIHPLARAFKEAGNRVLALVDVKADYLLYWRDRLEAVADELVVSSRDGLYGGTDYVPGRVRDILAREKIDRIVAVGCTYFMSSVAEASRPAGVRTMVSLNPIMVDGTGMCGACRVTVDGRTRFACVDGPDFDGHLVDWAELYARRKSYFEDEVRSLCAWEEERFP
ncbi:MAG TPA: sulfide/dihydroorotate dehydrogenase-like FAD/NAD-binding protein [Candidatus Aminicenantes bacterium]|nr:sulfide/dihydroorotate dehydrogenase-like FAD/NAD-binding protein [Candidatus Aminicenantes bacterium]HRY64718.1 sulfide/dihydroorotate dehydrogenase-like FAD/NAD-binding protein [Candidatus Aminicenantes bacterium]HRZ71631.1 sulfide/dihydroorotate dehydrogenase-like FAD/NAD-binding protein [Candidatus Aminicenantes bacterium]